MAGVKTCEDKINSLEIHSRGDKTLSDMPEELLREVCMYLPTNQLHYNMRNVSKEMRSVIEDLKLDPMGNFIARSGKYGSKDYRVLSVFKQNNKILMSCSKIDLPFPQGWTDSQPSFFKAAFRGKFMMKKGEGVFEYRSDSKDWKSIEEPPEQFHSYSTEWISPSVLVCVGMQMAYMPSENWTGVACKVQLLNLDVKNPKWHAPPVLRDNPLGPAISNPYLFNVANGSIIMCGGYNDGKETLNGAYKGILSDNKDIIRWMELDSMPSKPCFGAAFKLKNKLYIFGGMNGNEGMMVKVEWLRSSLVYDLVREKWSKGPKLPEVFEFPQGFTDSNEEYAFIYGDKPLGDLKKYKAIGRAESYEPVMYVFHDVHGFQKITDITSNVFCGKAKNFEVVHTIN